MKERERNEGKEMSSSRSVPYVRIVHQPSSVYRMRYKKENRSTYLYSENAPQLQSQGQQSTQASNKKPVRKKGTDDVPDGTFPKIEVILAHLIALLT